MRIIFPYSLPRIRKRRDPEVNLGGLRNKGIYYTEIIWGLHSLIIPYCEPGSAQGPRTELTPGKEFLQRVSREQGIY